MTSFIVERFSVSYEGPYFSPRFLYRPACVFITFFIVFISIPVWASFEKPTQQEIERYLISQNSYPFEIGELKYSIFMNNDGASGRISVAGKYILKEDLYLQNGTEQRLRSAVIKRLGDVALAENLAIVGINRVYQKYEMRFRPYEIVNKKNEKFDFRGNIFFQIEVDGWSYCEFRSNVSITSRVPTGYTKLYYKKRRPLLTKQGQSLFFVEGTQEYSDLIDLAVMKAKTDERYMNQFIQDIERYIISQSSYPFEIGELKYSISMNNDGVSGRISVAGKYILKEDLYGQSGTERRLRSAVIKRLGDVALAENLAIVGINRVYQKYEMEFRPYEVVNKKNEKFEFRGNIPFQMEVDGWSYSTSRLTVSIRGRAPTGYTKLYYKKRTPLLTKQGHSLFFVEGTQEYSDLIDLAVMKANTYEKNMHQFIAVLKEFFFSGNKLHILRGETMEPKAVIRVHGDTNKFVQPHAVRGARIGWLFNLEGEKEVLREDEETRTWGSRRLGLAIGDKFPVQITGRIIENKEVWRAQDVTIKTPTRGLSSKMPSNKYTRGVWMGDRFEGTSIRRWTLKNMSLVNGGEAGSDETDDRVSGMVLTTEPLMLSTEVAVLAGKGELTVRALRAFGLLNPDQDRLVLSLSNRKVDLLSVGSGQLRSWVKAGGVGELVFSEEESRELRALLLKIESLEAGVRSCDDQDPAAE